MKRTETQYYDPNHMKWSKFSSPITRNCFHFPVSSSVVPACSQNIFLNVSINTPSVATSPRPTMKSPGNVYGIEMTGNLYWKVINPKSNGNWQEVATLNYKMRTDGSVCLLILIKLKGFFIKSVPSDYKRKQFTCKFCSNKLSLPQEAQKILV